VNEYVFGLVSDDSVIPSRWRTGSLSGAVSLFTLAAAFSAMFAGVPYWWAAFAVGYGSHCRR